jgi:lipoprotein NlpD
MNAARRHSLLSVAVASVLAACGSVPPAAVSERGAPTVVEKSLRAPSVPAVAERGSYIVKPRDTLFAIALDQGLDYRELAQWNSLDNPNLVRVGQVLRLTPPGTVAPASASSTGDEAVQIQPIAVATPVKALDDSASARSPVASTSNGAATALTDTALLKRSPKGGTMPYSSEALARQQALDAGGPRPAAASAVAMTSTAPSAKATEPQIAVSPAPTYGGTTASASTTAAATKTPSNAATSGASVASAATSAATSASSSATTNTTTNANTKATANSASASATATSAASATAPAASAAPAAMVWRWPVGGKVIAPFGEGATKGIDLAGKTGDPVLATAPGKVSYVGSSLRGYGKMVVIKHAGDYLSVYAHNSQIVVTEGATVAAGQKIAELGATDADAPKLHFELRRQGKPVDPQALLPAR